MRRALKSAADLEGYQKAVSSSGLHQMRNVGMRTPTFVILNQDWVTYVFKNAGELSSALSRNRLAFPYALRQEAHLLWARIIG